MNRDYGKHLQTETDWIDLYMTLGETEPSTQLLKKKFVLRWRLLFLLIAIIPVCVSVFFAYNIFIKGYSTSKNSFKSELPANNVDPGHNFNELVPKLYDKENYKSYDKTNSPEGDVTPTASNNSIITPRVIIVKVTDAPATNTSKPTITNTYYGFEGSTQGWSCSNLTSGPSITTEWKSKGSYSLKCVANTNPGTVYNVSRSQNENYSNVSYLNATVKCKNVSGMTANLFILSVSGSNNIWSETGRVELGSSSVKLSLSLSNISSRNNVKAIGVEFAAGSSTNGTATMYIDNVYVN